MSRSRTRIALQAKPQETRAVAPAPAPEEAPAVSNPAWCDFALAASPAQAAGQRTGARPKARARPTAVARGSPLFPLALASHGHAPPPRQRRTDDIPLALSTPADPAEREADRIADQVAAGTGVHAAVAGIAARGLPGAARAVPRESMNRRRAGAGAAAAVDAALSGTGEALDGATRRSMERSFGADFSAVRVHTDAPAAQSAASIQARAYASANHVVFNQGEYAPATPGGKRLLAHELTHVVQQGAAAPARHAVPPMRGPTARTLQRNPDLEQMIDDYFELWSDSYYEFEAEGNHHDAAYASRILLMLQGVPAEDFADEDELLDFFDQVELDALSEEATLDRVHELALRIAPGAFPLTWSDLVYDALYLDHDSEGLLQDKDDRQLDMETAADRVPDEVGSSGLPVPYAEAAGLTEFRLRMKHIGLERGHVVKDLAVAARDYAVVGWAQGFYLIWNGMAEMFADQVAEGETVVDVDDYDEFVDTRQEGLRALSERLAGVTTEELMKAADDEVTAITNLAFVQAFASTLLGLVPAMMYWIEGTRLFDEKLGEVDKTIAGEAGDEKIYRAMAWAWDNGYFGAAAWELLEGLWAEKWKILLIGGALVGAQFIPGVNVAVDLALIAYAGVDAVKALASLGKVFNAVAASSTAVGLQRNAAKMAASMEGDGLRLILDLLAVGAAARGIRGRADALKKGGLSEEAALKQAMKEATGKEAEALKGGAARARIKAGKLDPDGALEPLMDLGMNAEAIEQALISGLKPKRIVALADTTADLARAQQIIEYAGGHSAPVNALVDAGVSPAKVGEMMDARLGLRDLSSASQAVDALVKTGGNAASADAMVGTLTAMGEGGAAGLARLTPTGLANVYRAGGADALQAVQDTLTLEGSGSIVGLDDWVTFTIKTNNKTGPDLVNAVSELREAKRIAGELAPGERVRIGNDLHGGGGKSFDMVVEDAAGNAVRNIDVTSVKNVVKSASDMKGGVKHAIDKTGSITGGTAEATIRIRLETQKLAGGRSKVFERDGSWHILEKDGSILTRGDFMQETAEHLPKIAGSAKLQAVHVVRPDGSRIGSVINKSGTWSVVR